MQLTMNQLAACTEHYHYYPFDYIAAAVKKAGFSGAEIALTPPQVWIDWRQAENVEEVRMLLAQQNVNAIAVRPEYGSRRYVPFAKDVERAKRSMFYYENCFQTAKKLGAGVMTLPPNGACLDENRAEAFSRAASQLEKICAAARPYGVKVAVETMYPEGSLVAGNAKDLKKLVDAVDDDSLCVTLDTVEMSEAGETINQWFDLFGERIAYVRMSDGRKGSARCICGEGIFPMSRYFEQLALNGYKGPIALPLGGGAYDDPLAADMKNLEAIRNLPVWEAMTK